MFSQQPLSQRGHPPALCPFNPSKMSLCGGDIYVRTDIYSRGAVTASPLSSGCCAVGLKSWGGWAFRFFIGCLGVGLLSSWVDRKWFKVMPFVLQKMILWLWAETGHVWPETTQLWFLGRWDKLSELIHASVLFLEKDAEQGLCWVGKANISVNLSSCL